MSTSKNLRGFLPARKRGMAANSTGFDELKIASGLAQNIFSPRFHAVPDIPAIYL